jgi:hypothetical protein
MEIVEIATHANLLVLRTGVGSHSWGILAIRPLMLRKDLCRSACCESG